MQNLEDNGHLWGKGEEGHRWVKVLILGSGSWVSMTLLCNYNV
jgi:hypothetical protein